MAPEPTGFPEMLTGPSGDPGLRVVMDMAWERDFSPEIHLNHCQGVLIGANQAFNDGHVEWRGRSRMVPYSYFGRVPFDGVVYDGVFW